MSEYEIVDCMAKKGDIVKVDEIVISYSGFYDPSNTQKVNLLYRGEELIQDARIANCSGQYFVVEKVIPKYGRFPKCYKFYDCGYLFPWWLVKKEYMGSTINVSKATINLKEIPPKIKQVKFSNPATIVWFEDGDKVVVKANKGDRFDGEKGLAMALCKKVYGSDYYNLFKKFVWGKKDKLKIGDRVKQGKILKFNKQGGKALVQTKTKQVWIDRKLIEEE